jgi:hypothetical protein
MIIGKANPEFRWNWIRHSRLEGVRYQLWYSMAASLRRNQFIVPIHAHASIILSWRHEPNQHKKVEWKVARMFQNEPDSGILISPHRLVSPLTCTNLHPDLIKLFREMRNR